MVTEAGTEIPFPKVAERFAVSLVTVHNWRKGMTSDGRKLYAFRMGKNWYTTEAAIQEFKNESSDVVVSSSALPAESAGVREGLANHGYRPGKESKHGSKDKPRRQRAG